MRKEKREGYTMNDPNTVTRIFYTSPSAANDPKGDTAYISIRYLQATINSVCLWALLGLTLGNFLAQYTSPWTHNIAPDWAVAVDRSKCQWTAVIVIWLTLMLRLRTLRGK
jgi:hypothetical protein